MAEVDEIIRAATAAGELVIRLSDFALREGVEISRLIAKAVHDHGGSGAQVPVQKMAEEGAKRALLAPRACLGEIREMAQQAGVRFAATEARDPGACVLLVQEKDLPLIEDICRILSIPGTESRMVPDAGAKDLGLSDFPRGSSFSMFRLEPEDADRFFEAAESEGLIHAASGAGAGHVRIVVPDSELARTGKILNLAGVQPAGPVEPAASVVRVRVPLAVRTQRVLRERHRARSSGMVLSLSPADAASFRLNAFAAGIPFREETPAGGAVRFHIPAQFRQAAQAALHAAGIGGRMSSAARTGGEAR